MCPRRRRPPVTEGFETLSADQFAALSVGHASAVERLRLPGRFAVETAFVYPGKGPLIIQITSDGQTVRFSDGGGLLLYLESQGMELSMDPVISKTVFHALKETPGCGVASGQVYLDSAPDQVGVDLWRFLQIVVEIIGIRHSKYKDALVQLARAGDARRADWDRPPE
jgi:hypothetical protein